MKILHVDIEQAPALAHVWGLWGVNVGLAQLMESNYTLSWAAKWHGEKEMKFMSIFHNTPEEMVQGIYDLLEEADAVVHYNGKRFDIPVLNREFFLRKMTPPAPYHQVDLLKVIKREFRFISNKLDHVAEQLGLGNKTSHEGHKLWVKCMEGDPKAWEKMKKYNIQDVKLLEKLYVRTLPWIKNHPNHALYVETDRPVCTNCGSPQVVKRGIETTGTGQYQRYSCKACGTPLRGRTTIVTPEKRKVILTQSKI